MASRKRFHPDGLILTSSIPKRLYCLSDSSSCVDAAPADTVASSSQKHEHCWDPECLTVLDSASNLSSCDSKGSTPAEHYHVIYTKCCDPALKSKCEVESPLTLNNSKIGCEEEGSDVTYERNMKPHLGDPCSSVSRGSDANPYVNTRFAGSKRDTVFPNPSSVSSHMTEGFPCDSYASSIGKRNSGRQKWSFIENETPACMASSSSGEQFDHLLTEGRMSGCNLLNTYPSLCRVVSSSSKGIYSKFGPLPSSISYERSKEAFHLEGSHNSGRILPVDPKPSYVLSSGRLSLEEEARLGRRPPTIDQDFEDYFSSLML